MPWSGPTDTRELTRATKNPLTARKERKGSKKTRTGLKKGRKGQRDLGKTLFGKLET